jgi:hypothetical protein
MSAGLHGRADFASGEETTEANPPPVPGAAGRPAGTGPTITATLSDGPLKGRNIEAEVVEGRPPKTIDVPAEDDHTCRYCLADWVQAGSSARYTFLYRV